MTRRVQKNNELFLARSLAAALNEEWEIEAFEEPDLIVRASGVRFGLEVTELYAGKSTTERGSKRKRDQERTRSVIDGIRRSYEEMQPDLRLYVNFIGDLDESIADSVVETLIDMNLKNLTVLERRTKSVYEDGKSLILRVRRLPDDWSRDRRHRPDWYSVDQSIGWVEQVDLTLQERIDQKARRLDVYRKNIESAQGVDGSGSADVRLLVVSDHLWASGMATLNAQFDYNTRGFKKVYFYPFPRDPVTL